MVHSFCRRLTNAYRFNQADGILHYQPCCWIPFNEPITDKQSLSDAQNKIINQVELNVKKNCYECLSREKTNYRRSGRIEALSYVPDDVDGTDPYILEFQLDTECNAACSMCGPHFSSLWQKQLNITTIQTSKISELHDQFLNLFELDNVKLIRFLGGEPLLTNSHLTILSKIPNPSLVKLSYVTNGSIFPSDKVLEMWSKFKSISISFSIDGIQEQFEYIRWPLKWSRVSSNLTAIATTLSNSVLITNYTINPMNAWYINGFEEYIDNVEKTKGISIIKSYSPCFGDWATNNIPQSLYDELMTLYPDDHPIIGILKSFPPSGNTSTLINNMNNLDMVRNLDWQQTFSQVAHHFK